MITDGVHEPTGSKRHRGAGHPWHLPSLPATPSKRCRGASSPIPCADDVPHDSPRGQQSVVPRHPADTASTDAQPGLAWPGQRRTVREHDTRGNDGGFAALEAFCQRVAGVSHLYWCNSPLSCPGMKGVAPKPQAPRHPRTPKPPPPRHNGGFCTIRSILPACRRRVAPLLVQFPPFGSGKVAVRGGEEPTSQTTAATNADNGVSWARQSALWTQRRPAARVARTRTRDSVR